ncbi:MAG: thiamine pyrophosphate-dependent enzyme [Actinobacteria bacterium]|nr:thiamine pyrophosphate-dependent enzyme [Actinomycetota bacterium]
MAVLEEIKDYLNTSDFPLFWCEGCGNGIILSALLRSFRKLGLKKEKTVVVTGIGCWGKADDYIQTNALHGTHGRALPFATGVKAANPELTVVALMGDGDCATIGGNHFIHAARRNIGVTAIVSNNFNYGMTGGQYSATTPQGSFTTTSPLGNVETGFDLCALAQAAGAPYVARTSVYHVHQLEKFITEALTRKNFALVDVASSCPTYFGRYNGAPTPVEMMNYWKKYAVSRETFNRMSKEDQAKALITGKFVDRESPDYNTRYARIQEKAGAAAGSKAGGPGPGDMR